jgi:transcriptional regulator with XRE-family HTH domain
MELAKAFGIVLRELRKEAGLTQEGLGLDADLRRTFISLLELGQQQPTIQTIFKLSLALNTKPSDIISRVEDKLNSI